MRDAVAGRFVGASVPRVEDDRLLTGRGRYLDDVVVAGMLHAAFVRSPMPHGVITSIDVRAARALPGVRAVLTGADLAPHTHGFIGLLSLEGLYEPRFTALAVDKVRLVGDPVAIVVADSRRVAEDGCELVDVEYDALPPLACAADALDPGAPRLWPSVHGNVFYRATDTHGDVDRAFARADRVVSAHFDQHRHANQPMEPRGALAEFDPATGAVRYHSTTQSAHMMKWVLAMLGHRRPPTGVLSALAAHPQRLAAVARGARSLLGASPELLSAGRAMAPTMLRQFRRDPGRLPALTAAMTGLIAQEPAERPEVLTGDIGGAFGAKTAVSREDVAVYAAARLLRRSVKWTEDRNEHLTVGAQAREESADVRAAVSAEGTLLGLTVDLTMDAGAYPGFPYGAPFFARLAATLIPGPYRLQALRFDTTVVATNKASYIAYRGPWAIETWLRERTLDTIARELGIGRDTIRLRNMIGAEELPRDMVTGPQLDVRMSARTTLERALEVADFREWPRVQQEARAQGRRLGLGLATFIEPAPGPPGFLDHVAPGFSTLAGIEPARLELGADGTVTVVSQQIPHGQGHETTLAQIAATELGLGMDQVRVRFGDTRITPFSLLGTGGSRSAGMAGGVVTHGARTLRRRLLDLAADLMEIAPADLVLENGRIAVVGSPATSVTLAAVAAHADRTGAGDRLTVDQIFDGGEGGWTQATHACWVEVDTVTGLVTIPRYVVVEDCGEIINPAVVDGQIRGGVAQGVGAVLYERSTYGADGQFQAGTFMDYLIPTAAEIPTIEIHHVQTPSTITANYRGVGEGGMIGAPAAITSAIEDALADLGVRITEQHLPPARLLELAGVIPAD